MHSTHRRSKLETMIDILKICEEPMKPTRIMYAANLSYKPLRRYLTWLVEKGLLRIRNEDLPDNRTKEIYELTRKGRVVLRTLLDAKETVGMVEE